MIQITAVDECTAYLLNQTMRMVPPLNNKETEMRAQKIGLDLLSDHELDAVAGGCEIDIEIIKCPIGHLEVLTNPNNCPGVPSPQVVYSSK